MDVTDPESPCYDCVAKVASAASSAASYVYDSGKAAFDSAVDYVSGP